MVAQFCEYIKDNWILKVLSQSLLKNLKCQCATGRGIFIAFNCLPFQNQGLKVASSSDFKQATSSSVLWRYCQYYSHREVLLGFHKYWFKFNLKNIFKIISKMKYETEYTLRCIIIYQIFHTVGYYTLTYVSKLPHFVHALESGLSSHFIVYIQTVIRYFTE